MGLPSKKRSKGEKRRRASHAALTTMQLTRCPKCKHEILPHRACSFCGYYKGREVIAQPSAKARASKKS